MSYLFFGVHLRSSNQKMSFSGSFTFFLSLFVSRHQNKSKHQIQKGSKSWTRSQSTARERSAGTMYPLHMWQLVIKWLTFHTKITRWHLSLVTKAVRWSWKFRNVEDIVSHTCRKLSIQFKWLWMLRVCVIDSCQKMTFGHQPWPKEISTFLPAVPLSHSPIATAA